MTTNLKKETYKFMLEIAVSGLEKDGLCSVLRVLVWQALPLRYACLIPCSTGISPDL